MAFSTKRRIEFRDTDAAGIVHFSAFFPMMEAAEHEMLRSLGIEILPDEPTSDDATNDTLPPLTWPRVSASCIYNAAARFEDLLTISVTVAKIGNSSVKYEFVFSRDDELIAEGRITAVCCELLTGGRLKKHVIPDSVRERLLRHQ